MRYADRDLILTQQDRMIHRCTCGNWVWGANVCRVCFLALVGTEGVA